MRARSRRRRAFRPPLMMEDNGGQRGPTDVIDDVRVRARARRPAAAVRARPFGDRLPVELKGDDTPVTEVDLAAEQVIRKTVATRFPGDGVLGEEGGSTRGRAGGVGRGPRRRHEALRGGDPAVDDARSLAGARRRGAGVSRARRWASWLTRCGAAAHGAGTGGWRCPRRGLGASFVAADGTRFRGCAVKSGCARATRRSSSRMTTRPPAPPEGSPSVGDVAGDTGIDGGGGRATSPVTRGTGRPPG